MAGCVRDAAFLHVRASFVQNQQQQDEVREAVLARLEALDARLPKEQRQAAVKPLAAHGEAALLARIKYRLDRAGYKWPEVTVTWQDLSVTRTAVPADESVPNLLQPLTQLLRRQQPSSITALQPTSGVLRPGTLTLLLGPAGCGRSTLLKALCGQLQSSSMVLVQGLEQLRYNGQTTDTFVVQRTAAYVDQVDSLMPTLTCRETLNFAEQCCGPSGKVAEALVQMMSWEEAHKAERCPMDDEADKLLVRMLQSSNLLMTEWSLTTLGLQHARDTLVGDALLRGVSGGEKRRVTVGEGLVGPAMVLMLDEANVGLDSSSTLALVQSMASWAKLLNTTIVMAMQQPEPAVTALFDDVILMSEGYTLWHGPASGAQAHFEGLTGCKALPGQDLADYLLQVAATTPQQQQEEEGLATAGGCGSGGRGSDGGSRVLGPAGLSAAFWESQQGTSLKAAAATVMTPTPTQLSSLVTKQMRPAWPVLLSACTKRMFKIDLARNWEACVMRWTLAVFIAVVMGLLFYQLPVSFVGGVNVLGMIYQALFFIQLLSLPTLGMTFQKQPILFRQRDALYYPAWVEWLPAVMLNMPILLVDVMLYGTIIYVMIGFTLSAPAYFTFQLILLAFALVCDNICRAYGSAAKVLNIAMGVGVCQALVNEMMTGFVMTPSAIPVYFIWAYYISPQAYAFRALALNELTQPRWAAATAVAAGSSGSSGSTLGNDILDLFQVKRDGSWVWDGVGVLLGMAGVSAAVSLLGYTYNKLAESPAVKPQQPQQPQQQLVEKKVEDKSGPAEEEQQQTGADMKPTSNKSKGGAVVVELPASAILAADTAAPADNPGEAASAAAVGVEFAASNISITFRGLSYFVPDPSGSGGGGSGGKSKGGAELQLLDSVTGSFRPGVMTALMGPSGAGKSTLIDVILGRKTAGRVVGDVRVCGVPQGSTRFSRLVGYCEQADIHIPLATVREALQFSAALRLTAGGSSRSSNSGASRSVAVAAAVDEVLQLVELEPLAGRLVGTPGVDGLSTEQRKRLTMAVELVTQPRVLFCDEPTSGLDGRGAMMVARVMQAVKCRGVAVVSTIHQPSAAIFGMFDELLLLQRGGKVVFNGPLGPDAANLVQYMQGAEPSAPAFVQGTSNPASWMFEVLNSNRSKGTIDLTAVWQSSSQAQAINKQVDQLCLPPTNPSATASLTQALNPAAPAGAVQQLAALLNRNFLSYWRNPSVNLSRFAITLLMAVIVGSIEWGKGNTSKIHDARGIQNCMGGIYILASALAVEIGFECQAGVAKERPVFYRERSACCYGSGVFLAAQALTETAYISLQVLVYTAITFFSLQLAPTASLFFYVLVLIWFSCVVQYATAQALVHISPSIYLATTLLSVLSMLQGLLGGFTRPLPATHEAWWPAFFLNPSFYTFIGIGTEVLGDVTTLIPDPSASAGGATAVNAYIQYVYGIGRGVFPGAWGSLGMLAVMTAVMLGVSFVGLKWGRFNRR